MDYFSKFLRTPPQIVATKTYDNYAEFVKSWSYVKNTLTHPDERQLAKGIKATNVHDALQTMAESLVQESRMSVDGETGACMEYLLKNDVLGTLVRLSEPDRPSGVQVEVLRAVHNLITDLDEQFLVHSVVHRAVLRLLKSCVGDDIQEQLDGRGRLMGAAGNAVRTSPSEYEEDLVGLLCLLCSRIRTFRELLMIFFYDKHWYHSETLSSVPEVKEDDDYEEDEEDEEPPEASTSALPESSRRSPSPTPSQITVTSAPVSSVAKKPEYEFLLFNYLLRFWHREGKTGDHARMGLIFLMDVAMSPNVPVNRLAGDESMVLSSSTSSLFQLQQDPVVEAAQALAEYILDGDFTEVLGAGLGAVYSILPSKLDVRYNEPVTGTMQEGGMVIGSFGPLSEEEKSKEEEKRDAAQAAGIEYTSSDEFQQKLKHFVKLLEFLQDVLHRDPARLHPEANLFDSTTADQSVTVGSAIAQSILDAVRRIFLENVLYPSILECSDLDGSAVAVLSYIDMTFRTLSDAQFVEMILDFLVSEDDIEAPRRHRRRPRERPVLLLDNGSGEPTTLPMTSTPPSSRATKIKRRKSSAMMLLEIEAPDARKQSGYLTSIGRFTLKDLLLANVRSLSQSTATAALQLMQTLIVHHCFLAVDKLFIYSFEPLPEPPVAPKIETVEEDEETFVYPSSDEDETSRREVIVIEKIPDATYSVHEREMELYLGLASRIDPSHKQDAFSTGYEHYLRDSISAITTHGCFNCEHEIPEEPHSKHLLNHSDPVVSAILESLTKFFSNSPETNIALTGMLVALAVCPERSLQGWLLFDPKEMLVKPNVQLGSENGSEFAPYGTDGDDRSIDFEVADRLAARQLQLPMLSGEPPGQPKIFTILKDLVKNLDKVRALVENFDVFLSERRQGLLFSENLTDALSLTLDSSNGAVKGVSAVPPAVRSEGVPETPPRVKSKAKSWVSMLTPRSLKTKDAKASPSPSRPTTPPPSVSKTVDASPFGSHYQKTKSIVVEPPTIPTTPMSGSWAPMASKQNPFIVEDDVFGSQGQWNEAQGSNLSSNRITTEPKREQIPRNTVSLSLLLDNAVILEECIKELTAIIHARRALGIDAIRYL